MIARKTNGGPPPEPPCWMVLATLASELHRQQKSGRLRVSKMDDQGRVQVEGVLDLAGIAQAAENGLRAAFEGAGNEA